MTMPTRRFANDDEAAQHWLTLLRDGDPDQKIQAREQLAGVFERKGMYEEAGDLLEANVRDGVRNADVFRWLARLYRQQGDEMTAMQAAAEAAKYLPSAHQPPIVAAPIQPTVPLSAQPTTMPLRPGQCPACGYENRNERQHCKRCRASLGSPSHGATSQTSTTPPQPKKSAGALKVVGIGCLGLVGVVFVLAVIGSVSGSSPQRSASPTSGTNPFSALLPATATPTVRPTLRPSIHLEGEGRIATNALIPPSSVSIMKLRHEGSRNIIVKAIRSNGGDDLLVNTIGRYEGSRPVVGEQPVTFDIQADGRWVLDLVPITPGGLVSFSGTGDNVSSLFDPPSRGPWQISHDGKRNFIVKLHCAGGSDLIDNRIGATNGSAVVSFGRGPCFWEVQADGSWSLVPR